MVKVFLSGVLGVFLAFCCGIYVLIYWFVFSVVFSMLLWLRFFSWVVLWVVFSMLYCG